MAVAMRSSKRRYGRTLFLAVAAGLLALVLVPLLRKEPFTGPLSFLNRFQIGEVRAAEEEVAEPKSNAVPEGKVRVLVSARPIAAYQKVGRDDVWNPSTGDLAYVDVDEDAAEEGGIFIEIKDILGRVLARPKSPGYAFTESDFLPDGTRPGIAAGVPPGKRALRIPVDQVGGIVGLQPGDRFDMVAAIALDAKPKPSPIPLVGLHAPRLQQGAKQGTVPRAKVEVLIQSGVVVSPLETRVIPVSSASLTQGTTTRTKPIQEMVIALDPSEVAPFLEAQSVGAELTCLARSGRPDDPVDSLTPSSEPDPEPSFLQGMLGPMGNTANGDQPMTVVESIQDGKRSLVPVPIKSPLEEPRE